MEISVKSLFELIIIVLSIKLIVSKWQPPIQESKQALICIFIGTIIGFLIDQSKEGIVTGVIGSSFAFFGEELVTAFKGVRKDINDLNVKNSCEELQEPTKVDKN